MKRIASIWLPNLAIERWAKSANCPPDLPVVLTVEGAHGLLIHAVTKAAADRGAQAGARLTDGRALDPGLVAIPADPAGDAELIRKLARWSIRWSPLVEADGPDALRLDVSGVAHLFGGEHGLITDIERCFAQLGLTMRMAIAPTATAAWALSHFSRSRSTKLASLPAAALRLDAETVRTLERLGLKTIGALIDIPRLTLARRFRGSENVIDALDRMLGRKDEPLTAAPSDPAPRASLRLEEPATHPEASPQALGRLIPRLVRELQERHLGARQLSFTGFRVDGSVAIASAATSIASRDPKHLQRLLAEKAAALDPEFGFDAFALQADWAEDLNASQGSLVEDSDGGTELARLVDRLTVKLGSGRVRKPQIFESHLPEKASIWVSAVASFRSKRHPGKADFPFPSSPAATAARPQRLLDRPEAIDVIYATPEGTPRRFVWRRAVHDIARVEGPERIAPEWWRQPSSARLRDYYRVEDSAGRRYWIYREGLVGDGRGGLPNWFIHGLFG